MAKSEIVEVGGRARSPSGGGLELRSRVVVTNSWEEKTMNNGMGIFREFSKFFQRLKPKARFRV